MQTKHTGIDRPYNYLRYLHTPRLVSTTRYNCCCIRPRCKTLLWDRHGCEGCRSLRTGSSQGVPLTGRLGVQAQAEQTSLHRLHMQEGKWNDLNSGCQLAHQAETQPPADACMKTKKSDARPDELLSPSVLRATMAVLEIRVIPSNCVTCEGDPVCSSLHSSAGPRLGCFLGVESGCVWKNCKRQPWVMAEKTHWVAPNGSSRNNGLAVTNSLVVAYPVCLESLVCPASVWR